MSRPLLSASAASVDALPNGDSAWKAFGTASSRILTLALGAITSVVISRALGPADRGAYYVIVTVATTAMLLGHVSIEQAQVYLWPDSASRSSLRANAVLLALGNGTLASSLAWVVVAVVVPSAVPVASGRLLIGALAAVPLGLMVIYTGGLLILDGKVGTYNIGRIVGNTAQCAGLLALVVVHRISVSAVVLAWISVTALPLLLYLPAIRPKVRDASWGLLWASLRVGARYHSGMAALFLLWRVDVFLLNARVSRAQVGLYSVAVTLAEATYMVTDSIGQAVLGRQVAMPEAESAAFTARVVRTTFVASSVLIACVSAVVPLLLPVVFGEPYRDAVRPLLFLGPGIVALASSRTLTPFLIRLNRPWLMSGLTVLALVVNLVLNVLLIPPFGISGASIASTVAYFLLAGTTTAWLVHSSDVRLSDLRPRFEDIRGPVATIVDRVRGRRTMRV